MGLRGPLGENPKRKKEKKKGRWASRPRWATWGPPRAAAALPNRTTHVGLVPHGGAKEVGAPFLPINIGAPLPWKIQKFLSLSLLP